MNIGKRSRADPITATAVIVVGLGAAMWLLPSAHVITQVGPTLAAASAVSHSQATTGSTAPTPDPDKPSTPLTRTKTVPPVTPTKVTPTKVTPTEIRPAKPAAIVHRPSSNLTSSAVSTRAATVLPPSAQPTSPARSTHHADSHPNSPSTIGASPRIQGPTTEGVPASISVPFASTHHPDGVLMTVLPHGVGNNGDLWIPGPEEGINDWADDVSWLNTPGFAAPFSSHGAIIIAGHINWGGTSGALSDLSEYGADDIGKALTVTMVDGRTRSYRITAGFAVDKSQLAAEANQGPLHTAMFGQTQIYGAPGQPSEELRLISCGGEYDAATRNYTSNIVITARPVD